MSTNRRRSPWAHDDSDLKCPRCGSPRIHRILDRWLLRKGVQAFECASCGRKFHNRGHDDYRPTFNT